MEKKLSDYQLGHLEDVACIYTAHSFSKISDKIEVKNFIYCNKHYEPNMRLAMFTSKTSFEEGFVLVPKNGCNLMYLVAILNSEPSSICLSEGKRQKKKAITLKALGALPIRIVSDVEQDAIAYLYYLILCVREMVYADSENGILQFRNEFYQEVLYDITLELLIPEIFEENGIGILKEWIKVVGSCCKGNKDIKMEQLQEEIGNHILQPGNQLTNSVKLFRFVNDEIEKQFERHEMENR